MWVRQQVGLYVWVWIGSVFRHLSGAGGEGKDERDGRHRRKQKHLRSACVFTRSLMCMTMMKSVLFL